MSVPTLTESRTYGRALTMTQDAILPGIKNNAYDQSSLMAAMAGYLATRSKGC